MSDPITSIARYRVKPDSVDAFLEVVDRHWATLRDLELATDREPEVYLGTERETGGPLVVEVFDWAGEDAPQLIVCEPELFDGTEILLGVPGLYRTFTGLLPTRQLLQPEVLQALTR